MKTPECTRISRLVLFGEGDTEMVSCSLLEYLALKAKCEYLSDLRFIHVEERWLREFILRSRDDFTPDEWKEDVYKRQAWGRLSISPGQPAAAWSLRRPRRSI